jgi:hypothetical protein
MLTILIPNYFKSEQENMNVNSIREVSQKIWYHSYNSYSTIFLSLSMPILPCIFLYMSIKEIVLVC